MKVLVIPDVHLKPWMFQRASELMKEIKPDRTICLMDIADDWRQQFNLDLYIQSRVIEELAEKGSCVIVGRCADYILRDKAHCLNVFIHASMDKRAERIVKEYGERDHTQEQRLKEKDKRRAAYHRFYTDMKWGHAQNYHICLDSGELGIEKCVELISQLY